MIFSTITSTSTKQKQPGTTVKLDVLPPEITVSPESPPQNLKRNEVPNISTCGYLNGDVSNPFLCHPPFSCSFSDTIMACCTTSPCDAFHPTCYDINNPAPLTCSTCASNPLATDCNFSYCATRLFPSGTTQLFCDVRPGTTSVLYTPLASVPSTASPPAQSTAYPDLYSGSTGGGSSSTALSAGGAIGIALGISALMLGAWLFAIGRSKPGTGGGATLPPSTGLLEEEGRGRREAAREPYGSRPQAMSGDYQQTWVEQSHRPPSRDNHVETTFEAVYVDQSNDGGGGF